MSKTCPNCGTTYPDSNAFCTNDGTTLLSDESSSDLIGSVIADRYRVKKLLGEGGMGRVYLAEHVRLPQQAAIKVLHPSMVQDAAARSRFVREAENAARIEHDRVARVFDFGSTSDGLVYMAMEFVPGRTLRSILEEQPRLAPARAANIIYQVAEGLDAAHRMTIVHRDLKPDNIMLITDESGVDRAKVVDFGIAKSLNQSGTQLTQAGSVIGTPEFMSPEQVFGEPLDARSDVYALALVGFQLFTGLLPFDSSTPERSLTARIVSDPRTLAESIPEVAWPDALQRAYTLALAREPDARTATALEFADAVVAATEAWIGTPVLRTRTPLSSVALGGSNTAARALATPGVPTVQWSPEAPKSAVDAMSIAGGSSAVAGAATAQPNASSAVKPSAGSSKGIFAVVGVLLVAGAIGYVALRGGSASAPTPTSTAENGTTTSAPSNPSPNAAAPAGSPQQASPGAATGNGGTTGVASSNAPPASAGVPVPPGLSGSKGEPQPAGPSAGDLTAADDAKRLVSSLQKAMIDADSDTEAKVARAAIPQLQQALTKLATGSDSTWAYIALANAYGLSGEPERVCVPLRSAKRLAKSEQQLVAVTNLQNAVTCAP